MGVLYVAYNLLLGFVYYGYFRVFGFTVVGFVLGGFIVLLRIL